MVGGHLQILLVDDDDNDAHLVERALERVKANVGLNRVRNGEEAIAYLQAKGEYADRARFPFPNLIVTDLKMPLMDGLEFLRWVKNHPVCKPLPVIMLSASGSPRDVQEAYRQGVTSYFVKPSEFGALVELILNTHRYWSRTEPVETSGKCE